MTKLKHKLRNFFIWCITVIGVVRVYRVWARQSGPLVRVLVFHDIHSRRWFEHLLEDLTLWFHFVTPEEFHAQKFHSEKVNLLITFDDGYASWESAALSVLEELNLKALFFVNSALLDIAHDPMGTEVFMRERLLIGPHAPLTWEGVKKLHNAGHTIGGHSCTHPNLTKLSKEEVVGEILDDKHAIERHINSTLTDFAYPFGTRSYVNQNVQTVALDVGYGYLYTATSGFVDFDTPFAISRMCVESDIHSRALKRWVLGGYDIFLMVKKLCVR